MRKGGVRRGVELLQNLDHLYIQNIHLRSLFSRTDLAF